MPIQPPTIRVRCGTCVWRTHFEPKGDAIDAFAFPSRCPRCVASARSMEAASPSLLTRVGQPLSPGFRGRAKP